MKHKAPQQIYTRSADRVPGTRSSAPRRSKFTLARNAAILLKQLTEVSRQFSSYHGYEFVPFFQDAGVQIAPCPVQSICPELWHFLSIYLDSRHGD